MQTETGNQSSTIILSFQINNTQFRDLYYFFFVLTHSKNLSDPTRDNLRYHVIATPRAEEWLLYPSFRPVTFSVPENERNCEKQEVWLIWAKRLEFCRGDVHMHVVGRKASKYRREWNEQSRNEKLQGKRGAEATWLVSNNVQSISAGLISVAFFQYIPLSEGSLSGLLIFAKPKAFKCFIFKDIMCVSCKQQLFVITERFPRFLEAQKFYSHRIFLSVAE